MNSMPKASHLKVILIVFSLLGPSAHAGRLFFNTKEKVGRLCEALMAGPQRPTRQELSKMSDVELAHIYLKFMMPGFYSFSELKGLPLKEDYYQAASLRQDGISKHVHQIIQSYDSSVPSHNLAVLPRLVIVTHQAQGLQNKTAQYLRRLENVEIPILVLLSEQYKLTDRALAQRASFFRYSLGGEMVTAPFLAKDMTLVGGFSHACLASTARDLIVRAEEAGMKEILLRFETQYIYETPGGKSGEGPIIKDLKGRKPVSKEQFFEALNNTTLRLAALNENMAPQFASFTTSGSWLVGTYLRKSGMKVHIAVRR